MAEKNTLGNITKNSPILLKMAELATQDQIWKHMLLDMRNSAWNWQQKSTRYSVWLHGLYTRNYACLEPISRALSREFSIQIHAEFRMWSPFKQALKRVLFGAFLWRFRETACEWCISKPMTWSESCPRCQWYLYWKYWCMFSHRWSCHQGPATGDTYHSELFCDVTLASLAS